MMVPAVNVVGRKTTSKGLLAKKVISAETAESRTVGWFPNFLYHIYLAKYSQTIPK